MGVPIASLLKELSGGDLRSSGRANHIVARVAREPALFRRLFRGLSSLDRIVGMRAADAIEKITVDRPELLLPYKRDLLELAASSGEKEFRWHMALLLPRLKLRVSERAAAMDILHEYLGDGSSIVRTCAMQGLADFACQDVSLIPRVRPLMERLTAIGTAAMRARGRKILKQLNDAGARPHDTCCVYNEL
jgi:hypothetical protein